MFLDSTANFGEMGVNEVPGILSQWVLGPLDPWQAGSVGVGLRDWGCFGG